MHMGRLDHVHALIAQQISYILGNNTRKEKGENVVNFY